MHCLETRSALQLTLQQPEAVEAISDSVWRARQGQTAGCEQGLSERQAAAMRIWLSILTIVGLVLMSAVLSR